MKICGILLIILCCSLCGFSFSGKLTERLRMLEEALTLIQTMRRELMLTHASCTRLLEQLEVKHCQSQLLKTCFRLCEHHPFPQAWKQAVAETLTLLTDEQIELITSVGSILGSGDLQHQEEAILQCEKQIDTLIKTETETCRTQGNLYRNLGILTGFMIAIVLA